MNGGLTVDGSYKQLSAGSDESLCQFCKFWRGELSVLFYMYVQSNALNSVWFYTRLNTYFVRINLLLFCWWSYCRVCVCCCEFTLYSFARVHCSLIWLHSYRVCNCRTWYVQQPGSLLAIITIYLALQFNSLICGCVLYNLRIITRL